MQTEISIHIYVYTTIFGACFPAHRAAILSTISLTTCAIYLHANARSSYSKYVYLYGLGLAWCWCGGLLFVAPCRALFAAGDDAGAGET